MNIELTGAERDVLHALFTRGPLGDGDLPSKVGRDNLVNVYGMAHRGDGWNWITGHGVHQALALGMDVDKRQAEEDRAKLLEPEWWNDAYEGEIGGATPEDIMEDRDVDEIVELNGSRVVRKAFFVRLSPVDPDGEPELAEFPTFTDAADAVEARKAEIAERDEKTRAAKVPGAAEDAP